LKALGAQVVLDLRLKSSRDRTIAFSGGGLVTQGHGWGGVAQPVLHLADGGAGLCS